MSVQEFIDSLKTGQIPNGLTLHLQALWYDGVGNWEKAHELIDSLGDKRSAHLHAYLHRKEGDIWNADYWYSRAGQNRPLYTLEKEWEELVKLFI